MQIVVKGGYGANRSNHENGVIKEDEPCVKDTSTTPKTEKEIPLEHSFGKIMSTGLKMDF